MPSIRLCITYFAELVGQMGARMNFTGYRVTDASGVTRDYQGASEVTVDDNGVLTVLAPAALVVATYAPGQWHLAEGIPATTP